MPELITIQQAALLIQQRVSNPRQKLRMWLKYKDKGKRRFEVTLKSMKNWIYK